MNALSDTPKMIWSRPPVDVPFPLTHAITMSGYHDIEIELIAQDLMQQHGDWKRCIEELF